MRTLAFAAALAGSAASADVPAVVTDIAPIHALTATVMGDLGQPALLLDQTADPHSFQLRPSQARALAQSDLVIWMGPALTPWLAGALETLPPNAGSLPLLEQLEQPLQIQGAVASPGDTDHADHGPVDPHAWLDPLNAAFYLQSIAAELARFDPANAATYTSNAKIAASNLNDLTDALQTQLAPLHLTTLIAYHDDLRYFLTRFGLSLTGALTDTSGTPPGAARLSALRVEIDKGSGCILVGPGSNADLIAALDPEQKFKVVQVDPLGSAQPAGPDLYITMIRNLADQLATCAAP